MRWAHFSPPFLGTALKNKSDGCATRNVGAAGNDYRMRRDPLHRRHLKKRSPIMAAFFGYLVLPFVGRSDEGR